ncbi:MAG: hypothetical protein EOP87_18500 [Verrucomicrobiaceae bacterium]|nr:MAG: hypothetical protein EOP87_18500 [Verrucomicrobiaceae bacterium]
MRSLALLALSASCLVMSVGAEPSQAGGTWFFSLPTKSVEQVRKMTKDAKTSGDVRLVEDILREKSGVDVISHWWTWPQWDDRAFVRRSQRYINRKGAFGQDIPEDALLSTHHKDENGVGLLSLGLDCIGSLSPEGKDYIRFTSDSGLVPVLEGKWCEMAAWEQGDRTWLLWQRFPESVRWERGVSGARESSIPLPSGAPEDLLARLDAQFRAHAEQTFTVELQFFKTPAGTLAQLAKAGPDHREKAAQWMLGRGSAWRKMQVCQRVDGVSRAWSMSHEKLSATGKSAQKIFTSTLDLKLSGKRDGGVLSMEIAMNRLEGDSSAPKLSEDLTLEKVTPEWNFVPLQNSGAVNVLLYREVKAD